MSGLSIRNAIGPVLFLVAIGFLVCRFLWGCTPAEANAMKLTAENAAAVAQYDQALVECQQAARQKPKELRFEAYTDCEQAVSKHFCAESEELRREWPRCKELER
jgi:hypothetical protein